MGVFGAAFSLPLGIPAAPMLLTRRVYNRCRCRLDIFYLAATAGNVTSFAADAALVISAWNY